MSIRPKHFRHERKLDDSGSDYSKIISTMVFHITIVPLRLVLNRRRMFGSGWRKEKPSKMSLVMCL